MTAAGRHPARLVLLVAPLACFSMSESAWAHGDVATSLRYERDIRPILLRACAGCHVPGGQAPMPLRTYEETRPWATAIKEELLEHRMPPWPAVAGFGAFQNAPALTQRDIDRVVDWVEGGGPQGPKIALRAIAHLPVARRADPVGMEPLAIPVLRRQGNQLAGNTALDRDSWIVGLRLPSQSAKGSFEVVARPPNASPRILLRTLPDRGPPPGTFYFAWPLFLPSGTEIVVAGASPGAFTDGAALLSGGRERPRRDPAPSDKVWAGALGAVGFTCPMHPQVVGDQPGSCPLCGMSLIPAPAIARDFDLELSSGALEAGHPAAITLRIRNPLTGAVVQDFALIHERPMHAFIVSDDLSFFEHVHPDPRPDGAFELPMSPPVSGLYRVFVEVQPVGGSPQLLRDHLATIDYSPLAAPPPPAPIRVDEVLRRRLGRTDVALRTEPAEPLAGKPLTLEDTLSDVDSQQPLRDLEPYLGALAHVVMVEGNLEGCIHAHPREATLAAATTAGGTRLTMRVLPPREGPYRIWAQFVRAGELTTAVFTIGVGGVR